MKQMHPYTAIQQFFSREKYHQSLAYFISLPELVTEAIFYSLCIKNVWRPSPGLACRGAYSAPQIH